MLQKSTVLTSWKSDDISQTRQELGLCISHLCLSERKKSRSSGVWVSAWTMQFMKQVLPRLMSPRRPGQEAGGKAGLAWALNYSSPALSLLLLSMASVTEIDLGKILSLLQTLSEYFSLSSYRKVLLLPPTYKIYPMRFSFFYWEVKRNNKNIISPFHSLISISNIEREYSGNIKCFHFWESLGLFNENLALFIPVIWWDCIFSFPWSWCFFNLLWPMEVE